MVQTVQTLGSSAHISEGVTENSDSVSLPLDLGIMTGAVLWITSSRDAKPVLKNS